MLSAANARLRRCQALPPGRESRSTNIEAPKAPRSGLSSGVTAARAGSQRWRGGQRHRNRAHSPRPQPAPADDPAAHITDCDP